MQGVIILIAVAGAMFLVIGGLSLVAHYYTLDGIKNRTVGDGQHGTARFASTKEIQRLYVHVPFQPDLWRAGKSQPDKQGVILGSTGKKGSMTALVDTDDVHVMMIAASGAGKTAFFLYPNLEYACATGMSFLTTDTKGDLARYYGAIAKDHYGYSVAVIDLRNPTRSDGFNMLHMVNRYMAQHLQNPKDLASKAKAEKYAKITAKTIISADGDSSSYGQNAFFYDAAEGVLAATILLLAEFLVPVQDLLNEPVEKRHIVSVFKLVQDLIQPSKVKGKTQFRVLMEMLPENHKAKWLAGAGLNSSEQAMASVLSTVLSRLNVFLDSELEQILCFGTSVDAEVFCKQKSAVFFILPEEDATKYFLVSLFIQQFYREMLVIADEHGGRLPNRVALFLDELGTIPAIESLEMAFSALRSRGGMLVPIIQSHAQLRKNYGNEGAEIIVDNCADTIFGGFAPNSESAKTLSAALGSRTVMSGSISRGRNDPSQSLQMMERPLMTPDELKSLPKGHFVVMKTGANPMRTRLRLFLDWGITFGEEYRVPEKSQREVSYASKQDLENAILESMPEPYEDEEYVPTGVTSSGGVLHSPALPNDSLFRQGRGAPNHRR